MQKFLHHHRLLHVQSIQLYYLEVHLRNYAILLPSLVTRTVHTIILRRGSSSSFTQCSSYACEKVHAMGNSNTWRGGGGWRDGEKRFNNLFFPYSYVPYPPAGI